LLAESSRVGDSRPRLVLRRLGTFHVRIVPVAPQKNALMLRKTTILILTALAAVSGVSWLFSLTDWVSFQVSGTLWADRHMIVLGNTVANDRFAEIEMWIPGTFWPEAGFGTEFGFASDPQPSAGQTHLACRVPWWPLFLIFGAYPFVYFVRQRPRERQIARRREHGQCIHCGYDLTGNQSGTCPECGRDTVEAGECTQGADRHDVE